MVKLIKADLRKDRAIMIIFLLIMILSTMLMNTGLMASRYRALYDEYAEETDLADIYVYAASYGEDISEVFDSKDYIEKSRITDIVDLSSYTLTTSKSSKEKESSDLMISSLSDNCGCDKLEFVERDDSVEGEKIYLNIYTAYSNSLCVGDKMYIDSELGKYEYTVAGIFQHLFMGNSQSYYGAMVEDEELERLKSDRETFIQKGNSIRCDELITVHIRDGKGEEKYLSDIISTLMNERGIFANGFVKSLGAYGFTIMVNVIAGFMGAFALIMLIISVIMVVFTISNNINRDIINIGAQRAVGFTVGQIRSALMAEYILLGAIGTVIGIVLSYTTYPVLDLMYIREISGMIWKNRFFAGQSFGILAGIILLTVAASYIATMKIRKLHPAVALRFGLSSNSFKKNHLPLDKAKGELNLLLAVKSTLQNTGQAVIVFCIVCAVSFVTMFSAVMYYNTKVDITKFQRMVQGDVPDAQVMLKDNSNEAAHKAIDKLKKVDGISQAYILTSKPAEIGDSKIQLIYISDPECVDCGVYEGEMLREDNEAVLGSSVADELGLGVGDEVEVKYNGSRQRFLITGLQQSAVNMRIYISEKAAQDMGVETDCDYIRVRVKNASNENVDKVLDEISSWNDSNIVSTSNVYEFQHSNENTPVFAAGFIVLILVILNVATIILVIRLLLKTEFIKKEKEFGIKKAVGFTSTQLRYQLSLSLLPTTLTASVTGAVLGYFLVNPMFTGVLYSYGIRSAVLIIKPVLVVLTIAVVTALVFLFSFIMSGRMKKLSAYRLIRE